MEWIKADNPPEPDENSKDQNTVLILLNGKWRRTGRYDGGIWYYNCGIFISEIANGPYKVTHWMPLPEPPKE